MRILFVYRYLTMGGCETVLRTRIDELKRRGHDARAWFLFDLGGRELFADIPEVCLVGDLERLRRHWGLGHWDLISSLDTDEVLGYIAEENSRPPLVMECHSSYPESLGYLSELRREQVVSVAAPSRHQALTVKRLLRQDIPVHVLANPIHPSFLQEPRAAGAPAPLPILAWIGRLDSHKNWRGALELGRELQREGAAFQLWLVARPTEEGAGSDLYNLARSEGLLPILKWYRGLPHSAIGRLLDTVRGSGGAVACTSRDESFGMAVVEAMARGCCVIAPGRGPFTEFIEHTSSGLLFDDGDYSEAARFLKHAMDDPGRIAEIGRRARENAVRLFSPRTVVDGLERFVMEFGRPAS